MQLFIFMISVVVLTKNNEKTIQDCLESVKWVDEIIIVDSGSTDKTLEIAKKFTQVKIYHRQLDDFSSQKNFGMNKCGGKWVLFLDSDETISGELRKEMEFLGKSDGILHHSLSTVRVSNFISRLACSRNCGTSHSEISLDRQDDAGNNEGFRIAKTQNDDDKKENVGFRIRREDVFMGKVMKYGETGKAKFVRLVKNNSGKWQGKVHEEFVFENEVKICDLENVKIIHNHNISVSEFFERINFYSDLMADELKEKGIKENFGKMFVWPMGKFVNNYFIKLGFADGLSGFILAYLMSWHSFLVRIKLRLRWMEENSKVKSQNSKPKLKTG